MWLMEQVMWKAKTNVWPPFLLEEAAIENTNRLQITHETIANHLGTHRGGHYPDAPVFQSEKLIKLSRGVVEITDSAGLAALGRYDMALHTILIKPASGLCNMRCEYCFYCDEIENRTVKSYGMMSEETIQNLIKKLCFRLKMKFASPFRAVNPLFGDWNF